MEKVKSSRKSTVLKVLAVCLAALLLAGTIITAVLQHTLNDLIVSTVIGTRSELVGEGATLHEAALTPDELAEQIVLEGAVLLRNETNQGATSPVLPLSWEDNRTVAVLGWSATSWVPGGNGSGAVIRRLQEHYQDGPDGDNAIYAEVGLVDIPGTNTLGALQLAGINVYQPLIDFYSGYGQRPHHSRTLAAGRRPNIAAGGFSGALRTYDFQFYTLVEPYLNHTAYGAEYRGLIDSARAQTDTAIVVIGRHAGESIDAPKVQYKGIPTPAGLQGSQIADPYRHYLEISTEEEAMLRHAGETFENVIVIVNSTNTMELGFLDTIPGIDAALWVGATGIRSASALPRLLWDRSERREILGGVPIYEDGVPQTGSGTVTVSAGDRIPFNAELTEAEGRYLWPVVSPSGRLAGTFAFDMRTAASWNNAGDSNQHDSASGWVGTLGHLGADAPLEFGQRYFRGVTRYANAAAAQGRALYPIGVGDVGSENGVNSRNTNFLNADSAGANLDNYRGQQSQGLAYIDFSEGIYVGYKWYETADTMGVWEGFSYGQIPNWFRERIGTPRCSFDNSDATRQAAIIAHNEQLVQRSIAKIPQSRVCFRTGETISLVAENGNLPAGVLPIDAVVQFPFGFGLSYTEFTVGVESIDIGERRITDTSGVITVTPAEIAGNAEISIVLQIQNVGQVSGMEVVQLYYNPPWDTTGNGVEMASANLAAIGKTYYSLQPLTEGNAEYATTRVRVAFDIYDMASFDTNNLTGVAPNGGFVLSAGDYELSLRHNSHVDIEGIYVGEHDLATTFTLRVGTSHLFDYDPLNEREDGTPTPVRTRFSGDVARDMNTGGDGVAIDDDGRMAQLRRADFTGSFPVLEDSREITDQIRYINLFRQSHADRWRENFETLYGFAAPEHDNAATPIPGFNTLEIWRPDHELATPANDLTAEQLEDTDVDGAVSEWYDNPLNFSERTRMGSMAWEMIHNNGNWNAPWNPLWDDLTRMMPIMSARAGSDGGGVENATHLAGNNSFLTSLSGWSLGSPAFPLIGRPTTPAPDATNQMNSFRGPGFTAGSRGIGWPNATTVAQTFSYRLARRQGWEKGREARIRNAFGMLAPGVHIHRSPLNGRNFEYYSESAYLTGLMGANYIRGMMDMGIHTYIKHFVVYTQESNRNSLYIFLSEQTLREVYFVPFRMGILRYSSTGHGSVGMMSGYSRLGAMYEGGSFHLLTTVLRREWGFRGSVMTDWSDNDTWMSLDHKIRAGGDKGMSVVIGTTNRGGATNDIATGIAAGEFDMESNEIRHRIREAARNLNYTWLFPEYIHARFNPIRAGATMPADTRAVPNFNWVLMLFIFVWVLLPLSMVFVGLMYRKEIKALFKKKAVVEGESSEPPEVKDSEESEAVVVFDEPANEAEASTSVEIEPTELTEPAEPNDE